MRYATIIMVIIYILLALFAISIISLVGIFTVSLNSENLKKITLPLVSLSAGAMLGGAVLHLLPESLEGSGNSLFVWLFFLVGILIFFSMEKIVCWRHCHIPTSSGHPHQLGIMNLIGDMLHNLIDGIIVASAFIIDPKLGVATAISVAIHEIPQEIADFGVLIYAGFSKWRALALNFLTALTAFLGAFLVLVFGPEAETISSIIIPITAGGFIYIATADLIPELKKDAHPLASLRQLLLIILGIGLMLALRFME